MRHWTIYTHVNPRAAEFIADSAEEGGFAVDDEGRPTHDHRGNTVARFSVEPITADDAELLAEAYAGDERITDPRDFAEFLAGECGLDDATVVAVVQRGGFAWTAEDAAFLAEFRAILQLPTEERLAALILRG